MFGVDYFSAFILLFNLFLLLFMDPIAIFGTIHGFHCTISANFYIYLWYFQQKVFSFSKISRSQTVSILTHTHREEQRGESFKETNSGVYPTKLD